MADFALGLTKTAVEGTLSRVKLAIEEEAKLKEKVQQDLVFITGEFQMMQSFLEVANKERAMNKVVKTWVRQLRDLAFDVEDCVEFVVHLDNKSAAWWWRVVPSCMAPLLPLDEAVTEIKLLKARVEDLSKRNTRYNLISDSTSHSKIATTGPSSAFHILSEVWEAAGKQCGAGDLQKLINRDGDDLQVVSVWGSAGADLGAPYIIRKVYDNLQVCQEFKIRAWIKVVRPFNQDEFLLNLLTQFCASSCQAYEAIDIRTRVKAAVAMEDKPMKDELMKQMNEKRYLVVLEDLSTAEWDAIRMYLPDNKTGSRIIMSTKELGVALLCTGEPYQVSELRRFSNDQYICAFFKEKRRMYPRPLHLDDPNSPSLAQPISLGNAG